MAYDILITNGRIVDGSGLPSFRADLGIRAGKIAEIGKLRGAAARTIDADGLVVSPGFVDTHCHYDAQVTWDPLCSFSCYHGVTTAIIGNCSLGLAPVRPTDQERVLEFLSYVEAIPMDVLNTVDFAWESIAQYMDRLDHHLGINVGILMGHTPLRHYVMGADSQGRPPTANELASMQQLLRDGIQAGALGFSVDRSKGHFDPQGQPTPSIWADETELFALGDVLGELGTGVIQSGGGHAVELDNRLMSRLSAATGRPVLYNSLFQAVRKPDAWKQLMAQVDQTVQAGIRAYPMCSPNRTEISFTMHNCQLFRGTPTWHPLLLRSDADKLQAYRDPAVREQLHAEVIEWRTPLPNAVIGRNWYDYVWIDRPALAKNQGLKGQTIHAMADAQGKRIIDAFLDLVVEEQLDTGFREGSQNVDTAAMTTILNYPNTIMGLSDSGAHVQFFAHYGYATWFLSHWIRAEQIMSLEHAVRRLTFEPASAFGIFDRGLLRPGLAADITIFDPETVQPLPQEAVHDLPAGGWRMRELASGIQHTIVGGQVLIEAGQHTGALPGQVLRNTVAQSR